MGIVMSSDACTAHVGRMWDGGPTEGRRTTDGGGADGGCGAGL
jgi:hypothetical protein